MQIMPCTNTYDYFVHCITRIKIEFHCLLIARALNQFSLKRTGFAGCVPHAWTDDVTALKVLLHNIFTIVAILFLLLKQSVRFRCSSFQIAWTRPNCTCPWHNCNAQCSSRWSKALSVKTVFVGCFSDCVWDSNLGHNSSLRKKDTRLLLLCKDWKSEWIVILRKTITLKNIH